MARPPRAVDIKRWRVAVTSYLEDFPRQLETLQFNVEQFGDGFDPQAFARAFESQDPAIYAPVQAIERGFGRLQNYMAAMAEDGARLAGLPRRRPRPGESRTAPDFEALRDAGVISKELCRKLIAAQKSRSLLEHAYIGISPTELHAAIAQLLEVAPQFLSGFSEWIERYLITDRHQ